MHRLHINYEWRWAASQVASGKDGADDFPENGTNAQPAGVPGDGGNGGGFTTNQVGYRGYWLTSGGKAGTKGRDCWGGSAGSPTSSAKYKLTLWHNLFGTSNANYDRTQTDSRTTKNGADAKAPSPRRGDGSTSQPVFISEANAWLHPRSLQKTLEYARDLFLAGARDETETLLVLYEQALKSPTPLKTQVWNDETAAEWTAAQTEVAAMLQRLRGQLDYFGNSAGYTPLLSLAGTYTLYEEETRRALRTLMLVGWIDAKERDVKESVTALGDTVKSLNEDTQQAASQVINAEEKINKVTQRIDVLEQKLADRSRELAELRTQLLGEAEDDLQKKARIKFAIKMAAAVCQVIPVGQPALGAIGSLGSVAADFIGGDENSAPDTVSKLGEVMDKAREASKKAAEAKAKAQKEKDKSEKDDDAKSAKEKASGWAKVGDGLGSALGQVSQGIKALQVPKSEVEAQLQRLQSESPKWNAIVKEITALNEEKAAFAEDLVDALQSLGEGYARISTNTAGVFRMQQEREKQIGKLAPAATGFIRQLGQRSRLSLLKYLYLMVKAYETTVFRPVSIDWKLTEIADKITQLLEPEKGFDAGKLNQHMTVLEPIYQANLDAVRKQLLTDFSFNEKTMTLKLDFRNTQTADELADLNRTGQFSLDPLAYGLVLPDYQLARLSQVELKKLEFDPSGPELPSHVNVIVSLQPDHVGTMRKGEWLYSVYSDEPMLWSWTYLSGEIRPSKPSEAAQDILDLVLGKNAGKIRQKVSLPPTWSELHIKVEYSPILPPSKRPRINRMYFEFGCDVSAAPKEQVVLTLRSLGDKGGAIIQCPPDLAGRKNGFDHVIRIYAKGAQVPLSVPLSVAGAEFESWDLLSNQVEQIGLKQPAVTAPLKDNLLAQCHWKRSQTKVVLTRAAVAAHAEHITKSGSDEGISFAIEEDAGQELMPGALLIRVDPADDASVIGALSSLNSADLLEQNEHGWRLVSYRGVVGWVRT